MSAVVALLALVGREFVDSRLQELRPVHPVHLHELLTGFRNGLALGFPLKQVFVEVLHVLKLLDEVLNFRDGLLHCLRDFFLRVAVELPFVFLLLSHGRADLVLRL